MVVTMQRFKTRTIEECEELVRQWHAGFRDEVIEEIGAEPTASFLRSFKPVDLAPQKPARKLKPVSTKPNYKVDSKEHQV